MNAWMALMVGSTAGGLARYGVSRAVGARLEPGFPHGTFWANMTGCLLIGIFHTWAEHRGGLSSETRLLLITGFCGAYTTFSSLILETSQLMKGNFPGRAALYVSLSLVLGLAIFRLGEVLGRSISRL